MLFLSEILVESFLMLTWNTELFVPVKIKSYCKYTYLVTSVHKENYIMIAQIFLGIMVFPVEFSLTILCLKGIFLLFA